MFLKQARYGRIVSFILRFVLSRQEYIGKTTLSGLPFDRDHGMLETEVSFFRLSYVR